MTDDCVPSRRHQQILLEENDEPRVVWSMENGFNMIRGNSQFRVAINIRRASCNPSLELTKIHKENDDVTVGTVNDSISFSPSSSSMVPSSVDWDDDSFVQQQNRRIIDPRDRSKQLVSPSETVRSASSGRRRRRMHEEEDGSATPPVTCNRRSGSHLLPLRTKTATQRNVSMPREQLYLPKLAEKRENGRSIHRTNNNNNNHKSSPAQPTRSTTTTTQSRRLPLDSRRRACILVRMGLEQLAAGEHRLAIDSIHSAAAIFRKSKKPVALAHALNQMGIACNHSGQWERALTCLHEALALRYHELGPCHVDTVETMQNLGNVYMCSGNVKEARGCFWQVFWVRTAIYGSRHPCVAVSAHDLANAFDAEDRLGDAKKFYMAALEIYKKLDVPESDPIIVGLRQDMKRVTEMEQSSEI